MRKPPTGEPCAGEPHARFGGRGGATLPDPYHLVKTCTFLPIPALAIYCNLYKYGLPITTILDVFRSVLDSSRLLITQAGDTLEKYETASR
jgi:hypothetical protein